MKKMFVLLTAAAMLLGIGTVSAQSNTIRVAGYAEMKVTPDIFNVGITLSNLDGELEAQQTTLYNTLKESGINLEQQLLLDGVSAYTRYIDQKEVQVSTRSYTLRLASTQQLQYIAAKLERAKITQLNVSVENSQMNDYKRRVRTEAMQNAQAQARTLAEAVGQTAGRCVEITDTSYSDGAPVMLRAMAADNATLEKGAAEYPKLEYQSITISYRVNAVFKLK